MIIIFSSGIQDISTIKVKAYLKANDVDVLVITPLALIENKIQRIKGKFYAIDNENVKHLISLENVTCVWLRKWNLKAEISFYLKDKGLTLEDEKKIKDVYESELNALSELIFWELREHHWIPSQNSLRSNKLIQMVEAEKIGFKVPRFHVLGNASLIQRLDNRNEYITKLSDSHFSISVKGSIYHSYTSDFSPDEIDKNVFPSLVQEKIQKKMEIRVFYLEENIHAFAIFSQDHERTSLDYRRYDYDNPTKIVPYKLDVQTEEKIRELHKVLDLNTGSSDFILDNNNEYHFLEINPFGQFGLLSKKCNFYLEKEIAKLLTSYEKKNKR